MSETDFTPFAEQVARKLWGDPNKSLSTKTQLRWGNAGSRKIDLASGTWFDHEQHVGGGVIDLIVAETKVDKAGAVEWLRAEGFIEERDSGPTGGHQRQEAERPTQEPSPQEQPPPAAPDEPHGEMVAVKGYAYTNRDGEPLYQVVRYQWRLPDDSWVIDPKTGNPKKTFRQRRKDASGQIVWNLDGIGHTLYRHPQIEIAISEDRMVAIVEGEKDAETLVEWGIEATTNSGGAQNWTNELAAAFRGADVVIMVDNDPVGVESGEKKAKSLRGIARRIRLLNFADLVPDFPAKHDVTDWKEKFGGTASKLVEILNTLPDWRPKPPKSQFGALGLDELHQPHLQHEFLIEGFLDRRGVAMMPGASGSGKTFLVLEFGMCVALGRDFWGMRTKPGLVVYQAGEGKEGITKRLDGWMLDRNIDPSPSIPFRVLPKKVNLFVDDKDTDALIEECRAWADYFETPMRMLVIDTFNKAITGANENAGQDMTRVLSRLERISETLDCAVVVPMHKGKNGDQRGHGSLTGDVSNVINVTQLGSKESPLRDSNGRAIRTVELDKNKDGEGGRPMRFVLRQVVLGIDENGKPKSTCVVDRPNGDENVLVQEGRLSPSQTIFLQTLKDATATDGIEPPSGVTSGGRQVVAYKVFAERLRNKWPFISPEHEVEKRNAEFIRAVGDAGKRLAAFGYVDRDNAKGLIWWTGKSDRPKRTVPEPSPMTHLSEEDRKVIEEAPF